MQCDVTRCVICISNNIEYLDKAENYTKFYQRNNIVNLGNLSNAIMKITDKMSCLGHFKLVTCCYQVCLKLAPSNQILALKVYHVPCHKYELLGGRREVGTLKIN